MRQHPRALAKKSEHQHLQKPEDGGNVSHESVPMSQSFRHPEILDIARRDGRVTVEGLADHFGVTLQTIRRDLSELAEAGRLERVHGGAVLPSGTTNVGYEERRRLNQAAKVDIARACAGRIPSDASVFLGIGTTTEAVAAELGQHRNLLVVTNNLNIPPILAGHEDCDVVVTGGTLRRFDGGLVGQMAADAIAQFRFDLAVIGCSALDEAGDILDFDIEEVGVNRRLLQQARRSFLVADHSKFQRPAPARIASLEAVDVFFTDQAVARPLSRQCRDWGTEVHVVGAGAAPS